MDCSSECKQSKGKLIKRWAFKEREPWKQTVLFHFNFSLLEKRKNTKRYKMQTYYYHDKVAERHTLALKSSANSL